RSSRQPIGCPTRPGRRSPDCASAVTTSRRSRARKAGPFTASWVATPPAGRRPKSLASVGEPMGRRSVDPQTLEVEIAALRDLDLIGLRERWQKLYGRPAPAHLPAYLLSRILAYKIQADALGGLDHETVRFLDAVAAGWKKRKAAGVRL